MAEVTHDDERVTGTTTCLHCGAKAYVTVDGGYLQLVCDECGFELWGDASETAPPT